MSKEIAKDLDPNVPVTILCILKGAFRFTIDLMASLSAQCGQPMQIDFLRLKSYENDSSTGTVKLVGSLPALSMIQDRHILIVEDIIDTGRTIHALKEMLVGMNPRSMSVATLLWKEFEDSEKNAQRLHKIPVITPDYVGFRIPDLFVIGYGLDYNEFYRDLDHICVINEAGKKRFAEPSE